MIVFSEQNAVLFTCMCDWMSRTSLKAIKQPTIIDVNAFHLQQYEFRSCYSRTRRRFDDKIDESVAHEMTMAIAPSADCFYCEIVMSASEDFCSYVFLSWISVVS